MKRLQFIKNIGLLTASSMLSFSEIFANDFKAQKIGACDWSLGQNSKLEAFEVAKAIGLSGIQVNLGTMANGMHLRQRKIQKLFKEKSKQTGVKITSMAIGELNNIPYKSESQTDAWVYDSIDAAKYFDVKVVLLAFFAKNDLRNDTKGIDTVIQKLKNVMPHAERKGITLGIESYLKAEEHLYIMEKVGSNNLKVYYDFRNAKDAGNDIFHETTLLGNQNICELHIKENGKFLGTGDIDWQVVANHLGQLGFDPNKWKQIEWSLPNDFDYVKGHQQNLHFLTKIS